LQHVLPDGFVQIRHYGLMASSHATTKLQSARELLTAMSAVTQSPIDYVNYGTEKSVLTSEGVCSSYTHPSPARSTT
jgi:hypothetical protein